MVIDPRTGLEVLSETVCRQLLEAHRLGRVGFVVDGSPMILPVNYIFFDRAVVFRTAVGSTLEAAATGGDFAFEIDEADPVYHEGWSVVVRGVAQVVTDPEVLDRYRGLPLRPWTRRPRSAWVRIPVREMTGRRIPPGVG